MAKIYDSWSSTYKSKFGAIKRRESCNFTVRLPKSVQNDIPPILVVFQTGYKERFFSMNEVGVEKEYVEYMAEFVPNNIGVHYYYFTLMCGGNRVFIKRKHSNIGVLNEGELFQLTVYDENYTTPDFIKGGIIYQIFPDRFCKSGVEHKNVPNDRIIREDWEGIPYYKPDQNGIVMNNDYFGGDIEGIMGKLDYISSLKVNCIYLNPIFEAHENHRYNTANYRKVDPMLGTEDDFKRLCEEAKKRNIGIILDGVFSHTGADSIYFNKYNRYESNGAFNSRSSEFYDWYTFTNYPNEYESWWGINTLPNVNETNSRFSEYICGVGGVIDYWLSLGAAGFRLDVADELPDSFLDSLRYAVKRNGEDKLLIGEVWEDASNKESYGIKRKYLLGTQLDSTMNYPFKDAILGYILGGSAEKFKSKIMTILENYPKPSIDALMNLISTHDIERAINILGGGGCEGKTKEWQSERTLSMYEQQKGVKRLKSAMVLQFFLPGVPSIYYGDEVGMQGDKDPFNRKCYPWGKEDNELLTFVRELGEIRRSSNLFKDGQLKFILVDDDLVVFSRICKEEGTAAVIILNKSSSVETLDSEIEIKKVYTSFELVRGELKDGVIKVPPFDYAVVMLKK